MRDIRLYYLIPALPQVQYVNDKPYHLMQTTECRGGKVYEINQVQVTIQCISALKISKLHKKAHHESNFKRFWKLFWYFNPKMIIFRNTYFRGRTKNKLVSNSTQCNQIHYEYISRRFWRKIKIRNFSLKMCSWHETEGKVCQIGLEKNHHFFGLST